MPQTEQILDYMATKGPIDPLTALQEFGCFRLGARIWELKAAGFPVTGEIRTTKDGKRYKAYWLKEPIGEANTNRP